MGQAERSGGALVYDGFAEFEAAVDLLLANDALADELGANGRAYVEDRYRWDDLMERYEDLLGRVVEAFDDRPFRGSRGR